MTGVGLTIALLGCTFGGATIGVFVLAIFAAPSSHRAARACIVCGCTDWHACPGGCSWVSLDPPLCSAHSSGWAA